MHVGWNSNNLTTCSKLCGQVKLFCVSISIYSYVQTFCNVIIVHWFKYQCYNDTNWWIIKIHRFTVSLCKFKLKRYKCINLCWTHAGSGIFALQCTCTAFCLFLMTDDYWNFTQIIDKYVHISCTCAVYKQSMVPVVCWELHFKVRFMLFWSTFQGTDMLSMVPNCGIPFITNYLTQQVINVKIKEQVIN